MQILKIPLKAIGTLDAFQEDSLFTLSGYFYGSSSEQPPMPKKQLLS
ncbi:MAG TPA: hypothetical protein VGG71_05890 [Chitinophagaceae bacterium]